MGLNESNKNLIRFCEVCAVAIKRSACRPSVYPKRRFCSNECRSASLSEAFKGDANPNYRGGKSICFDCKKELPHRYSSKTNPRCVDCIVKFRVGENHPHWKGGPPKCVNCDAETGDHYSVLCRKCYRGKLCATWRGGTATIQSLVRNMPENKQWIKQCMYRDDYECKECGVPSNGRNLQVHHIKQFAQIIKDHSISSVEQARECEALWDMDNGVTLCKACHKLTDSFNKKVH